MSYSIVKVSDFKPLKGKVFVTNLEHGERLSRGGIILRDDNLRDTGIRPRWGKVWAVGSDVEDIAIGEWVLIEHGRWTQKIHLEIKDELIDIWSIDYPNAVLLVSTEPPQLR